MYWSYENYIRILFKEKKRSLNKRDRDSSEDQIEQARLGRENLILGIFECFNCEVLMVLFFKRNFVGLWAFQPWLPQCWGGCVTVGRMLVVAVARAKSHILGSVGWGRRLSPACGTWAPCRPQDRVISFQVHSWDVLCLCKFSPKAVKGKHFTVSHFFS